MEQEWFLAIEVGNRYELKYLHEEGIDVNQTDVLGTTGLMKAAMRADLSTVKFLVEELGADVNYKATSIGWNVLFYRPYRQSNHEVVEYLLSKGADVNCLDRNNANVLFMYTKTWHVDCVKLFLAKGASVKQRDGWGRTPLHVVAQTGHLAVLQLLLEHGADIDDRCGDNLTPYLIANPINFVYMLPRIFYSRLPASKPMRGSRWEKTTEFRNFKVLHRNAVLVTFASVRMHKRLRKSGSFLPIELIRNLATFL